MPGRRSHWFGVGEAPKAPEAEAVYYSVHPTVGIPDRGRPEGVRSRTADIAAVNCVFADFDVGLFDDDWDALNAHVDALAPEPSLVYDTGGGKHCLWILAEPWVLRTDEDRLRARALQSAWVEAVRADPGAKDLARILRLPGTLNNKYSPPRPVVVTRTNGAEYTVDDLLAVTGALSISKVRTGPRDPVTNTVVAQAADALTGLSAGRLADYKKWLEVGMSLRELGDLGLSLWISWSRGAPKFNEAECSYRWETFSEDGELTLASLHHWAESDRAELAGPIVTPPPPGRGAVRSRHFVRAATELGWTLRINEMNDDLEANGVKISDPIVAVISSRMRDHRFTVGRPCWDALTAHAYENRYHPIRDYLAALEWDGEDHITRLAGYFRDRHDGIFEMFLRSFLIGAVNRVVHNGAQNRMLVLDGPQNLGKSYFARYLGSPLPGLRYEGPINPSSKDDHVRLMSVWVWEAAEMGATFRKADRESLKFFITQEVVRQRKPYGHHDVIKPAAASFIATVNNEAGFLDDPTGYRRFMPVGLLSIDWAYATEVDVDQVWAQAAAAVAAGETGALEVEQSARAEAISKEYEVEDPVAAFLDTYVVAEAGEAVLTTDLLAALKHAKFTGSDKGLNMAIAGWMRRQGFEKKRQTIGKVRGYYYLGISVRVSVLSHFLKEI